MDASDCCRHNGAEAGSEDDHAILLDVTATVALLVDVRDVVRDLDLRSLSHDGI